MNGQRQLLLFRPCLLVLVVFLFPFGNCWLSTPIERIGQALDEKLVNFVTSTTGIDLLEESYNDAKSRIKFDSVNGVTLVDSIAKTFGDLFGRKIEALQLALKHAEELTSKYQWNSKIKDVDVSYMHARDLNESSEFFESSEPYGKRVSLANSSAHIPVDIYKGDVEILNSLAWTAGMDQIWRENKERDPGLLWQYFGSQSGVLRFYPASKWRRRMDADLYDVRRRPWYTQGASSPKEMVILLDRSGSSHGQALSLMKHSVKSILETVGENDFVNVASFSETASWVGDITTLVQGNQRNKQRLSEFVDDVTASGVASYAAGLEFGFQQLENFTITQNETDGDGATCNQVIMFLTDGGTEMPVDVIRKYNPDKRVRIFSFAVGPVASLIPAVKWMACSNRGYFYQIPAMGAIRSKVQNIRSNILKNKQVHRVRLSAAGLIDAKQDYLSYLARPQALAPEGHFTTSVHLDELTTGLVATATVPVFNRSQDSGNQTLLGILGVDISMKELVDSLPRHKFGPNGYAFAINSNGFVVFHPQLKIRESSLGSPPSIDLLEVEEETPEKVSVRHDMIDRTTGFVTLKTYVIGLDEAHADIKTRTYYYTPIPNTNFSLGIVLPDNNKAYIASLDRVDITSATHLLQLNNSKISLDYGRFCPRLASPSTTLDAFVNFLYSNYTSCDESQVRHLLFDAQVMSQLHQHWVRPQDFLGISHPPSTPLTFSSTDRVSAIVVETNSGLTLVYPPNASSFFESTLNPWQRTHFKRAFDSDAWIYSLLTKTDGNTTDRFIMATKAVTINNPNAYKIAAVSLVFTPQRLYELISEEVDVSSPRSSSSSSVFYLLDDGAMIIDSSDSDLLQNVRVFFGLVQPSVMSELINKSFFISHRRNDYQRTCSTKVNKNASLRLIPSFLYELISLRWWSSAYAWAYFHLYSWLFHGAHSSSALEEEIIAEQSHRTCILALQQYHFGPTDVATNSTKGTTSCANCTRHYYEAVFLRSSNLLLVVIEQQEDCSCTEIFPPYLPVEIGDPLVDNKNHVAIRYRRRPACYDENPHEAMSYCRGSLATTPIDVLTLSILSFTLCSMLRQQLL